MKANGHVASSDYRPVGIWIRVSHEDSVKDESPEHHEYRARAYAELKGWDVQEVYRLDAVSGKSVKDLPETKRMLNDIRTGRTKGLIFSKLARLARNTRELLEFADIFQEYDADLISLQEAIDTSTPAGRLFYTMIAALAQWEREETSARVAASVPVRARLGKPTGGAAPYGYRWVNKQLEVDPEEAPIRKLMYELFLEHRRKKSVANALNEAGYRTRRGAMFSDTTVDRLLRDTSAKGKRRANYTKSRGEGKHWDLKPESEWVYSDITPIVSEELWDQVNAILDRDRKKRKRVGRKTVHLFAGVTSCECGTQMYVPSNSPKYICRSCRNKIPIEDLELVFFEQLKKFFFTPEDVAAYLVKADKEIEDRDELLNVLEGELRSVKSEMDKVYRLYIGNELSAQAFGRLYSPLEEREKQLEDEIPRVQGEIDFLKIRLLSSDEIVANAQSFYSRWPKLEFSEKRRIVENLVHRIEVMKETVLIELAFAPPAPSPSLPYELSTNQHNHTDSYSRPA